MRSAQTILILTPALFLAGCLLRGKPQRVVATPPPPAPVAKTEPAPPPQPLSVPQTTAELPPPQPVSPEAVAAAELPGGNATPSPAPARSGGARHVTTGPPPIPALKTEPAAPATPPAAPPAEASKPIQEIVPVEEQKRLQEAADARKRETRQALEQISGRRLSHQDAVTKRTIESYLRLSDQAEAKGDMRQASEIAERAWVLAKELQGVR
jgi:hypothetical protein